MVVFDGTITDCCQVAVYNDLIMNGISYINLPHLKFVIRGSTSTVFWIVTPFSLAGR